MLLLFLTFRLFFRGLGKLVQPGALPGPRMLLFLAVSAPVSYTHLTLPTNSRV